MMQADQDTASNEKRRLQEIELEYEEHSKLVKMIAQQKNIDIDN